MYGLTPEGSNAGRKKRRNRFPDPGGVECELNNLYAIFLKLFCIGIRQITCDPSGVGMELQYTSYQHTTPSGLDSVLESDKIDTKLHLQGTNYYFAMKHILITILALRIIIVTNNNTFRNKFNPSCDYFQPIN